MDLDLGAVGQLTSRPSTVAIARRALGRIYRVVRGLPTWLLHGRRYRLASRRLSAMLRPPRSILVVCYANICRSPYLAAVLQRALPDVKVTSAGLVGPGRPVPAFSLSLSAERGIDLSGFRSRPLAAAAVRDVDLVIVMDAHQASHVTAYFRVPPSRVVVAGDLDPLPSRSRAIEDPWQQPMEVFASSFNRLDRCAATLAERLRPIAS